VRVSGFPARKRAAPMLRSAAHGRRSVPLVLVSSPLVSVSGAPAGVRASPAEFCELAGLACVAKQGMMSACES
jgi:hypothetical protein